MKKVKFKFSCLLFVSLSVLTLGLNSCLKEKPIAPPKNQQIGETAIIDMGPEYRGQFYYSLATNSVISTNSRMAYDLMFDCGNNQFRIWLNSSKFMSLIETDKTDYDAATIQDTVGKVWRYELGEHNVTTNSFGEWWQSFNTFPVSKNKVYIINLGVDDDYKQIGLAKLQINHYDANGYRITFSPIGSNDTRYLTIPKDPTRNYVYASITGDGNIISNIEPDKTLWDLCFTRYSVVFNDPYYLPYEVTGVLQNPSKVEAYLDSTLNFNTIDISTFDPSRLESNRRDVIGYEWKRYDLGDYITKTWYTYMIKTGESDYYKLRFIDFKKNGVRGYPTFEFYKL